MHSVDARSLPAPEPTTLRDTHPPRRRVLVTGGAGRIATAFARATSAEYALTLLDLPGAFKDEHAELGSLIEADLSVLDDLVGHLDGIDTVVHLGGERRPGALWATLLPANVLGSYNVIAAALAAGCRRVVYASSVHAVSGHPASTRIRETDPARAADLYGATKCWGEALGSAASREGLSFAALRIGAVEDPDALSDPGAGWMVRDYCSPDDLIRLLRVVIEAADIRYEIFNASDGGPLARLSMEKAQQVLAFTPEADAVTLSPDLYQAFKTADMREKAFPSGFRAEVDLLKAQVPA